MTIDISRSEVLRYLAYRNQKIDRATSRLIDEMTAEASECITPRYIYRMFQAEPRGNEILLKNCTLVLPGEDIRRHLRGAVECALMAVTAGIGIEKRISYYSRMHISKGLVLDACATAAVETICSVVQEELRDLARERGFGTTGRYSPGYGDLPLTLQPALLTVLDAHRKIGLSATASCMLTPRKSVTAIVGFVGRGRADAAPRSGDTSRSGKGTRHD